MRDTTHSSQRRGDPDVGARIAARRKELGMSRQDLADAVDLSYPYISQIETGYRNVSYRRQLAIAEALGTGLDELFGAVGMRWSDQVPEPTGTPAESVAAPGARLSVSAAVAAAGEALESLPASVRLDALNQLQLRVMRSLTAPVASRTSGMITELRPNEVFVFGSNAAGLHRGGAARQAFEKFGAVWGQGRGHHGQSYAIDTMSGPAVLAEEVAAFLDYARTHPELVFLVTPIGTGIAGYRVDQVAPLFADVPPNVVLPAEFEASAATTR